LSSLCFDFGVIATQKCLAAYCQLMSRQSIGGYPNLFSIFIQGTLRQFEESLQRTRSSTPQENLPVFAVATTTVMNSNEIAQMASEFASFTDEMLFRMTSNSLKLIHRMVEHDSNCLRPNSPLLFLLRIQLYFILQHNGFTIKEGYRNTISSQTPSSSTPVQPPFLLSSTSNETLNGNLLLAKDATNFNDISEVIETQFNSHFELKVILDILLLYCRANKRDMFPIFDLVPVLCTPTTLDSSFLITFLKDELPLLYSPGEKRKLIEIFLSLIGQQKVCPAVQVKSIQVIILPILLQLLRNENIQERKEVLNTATIDLIMRYAFTIPDKSTGVTSSSDEMQSGTVTDLVKIELLKVTQLIDPIQSLFLTLFVTVGDNDDRVLQS
jgi:hypothetical protein